MIVFCWCHVTQCLQHTTMAQQGGGSELALRYKDKVTIVTGGSKGIGEGCVRVFGKCMSNYIISLCSVVNS